jgi:hypothetical protein
MRWFCAPGISLVLGFSSALCLVSLPAATAEQPLAVKGLVSQTLFLDLAELRKFPATHIAITQASSRGPVALDCTGASLSAILQRAKLSFGTQRNANLAHTLLISADDGYAVALSMGEIDPDYGHVAPLIATDCGGKPLDAPRLVVPGDVHAGRAVSGLVSIEVK